MGEVRILVAAAAARGGGMGHLYRAARVAEAVGSRCALLAGIDADESLLSRAPSLRAVRVEDCAGSQALVVADRRATGRATLDRLATCGTVVGIDEGGPARRWMPYLVDTLAPGASDANVCSVWLNDLPYDGERQPRVPPRTALVTFGGEDPAGLTGPVAGALIRSRLFAPEDVAVMRGPAFGRLELPAGVRVLEGRRLAGLLGDYDLVLTSYGLTCFEALAAGSLVVLVSPSRAHRRLARAARIPEAGLGRLSPVRLARLIARPGRLAAPVERLRRDARSGAGRAESLGALLGRLHPAPPDCPACGHSPNAAVARFPDRTYARCEDCGILYKIGFAEPAVRYEESYFFAEYRRQYGRTYLEDFESIRAVGHARLDRVERISGSIGGRRLLDVGCAYGPFLAAARDRGADVAGVEVSEAAARWVTERLGVPVWRGAFEDYSSREPVDILSMWYVIEHFPRLAPVLRLAADLVRPGGVLAFSTPNAGGISGRRSLKEFLAAGPADHYTIWDPRSARSVLSRHGFRTVGMRVTGHHPDRWPLGRLMRPGRLSWRAAEALSRALRLGDTFEVYAVREAGG